MPAAAGGFTCAGAPSAGTSAAATSSPSQHASAHATATGHPIIRSFEPGEAWFYSYETNQMYDGGPALAPPEHHPASQPVPGPAGRMSRDWQVHLH